MPRVRIVTDVLPPGAIPLYYPSADYPTYVVQSDGVTVTECTVRNLVLPVFEISGTDDEVKEKIGRVIEKLVLTAMFAGRVTIAVKSDVFSSRTASGEREKLTRIMNVGAMFAVDPDPDDTSGLSAVVLGVPLVVGPDGMSGVWAVAGRLVDGLTLMGVHGS